ncbi:MAG: 2-oxoacid:acceptor oxidoreductase family protein [Spirochaetaceae bacterium]|nr:MAG: 2-oxoacid:acceptor oxidoreductase family protein [Spirochaetaceae bacterium]
MHYNLLICGVGGQGILTLSEILGRAAVVNGLKAIVTVDRGLAQRGGSVKAHIRLGEVYSPMIPKYTAHGLLSLEIQETFGYVDYLNEDTTVVVSSTRLSSGLKAEAGGNPDWGRELHQHRPRRTLVLDSEAILGVEGFPGGQNTYLLGVLCGMDVRLAEFLPAEAISTTIESLLKRNARENRKLFRRGLEQGGSNRG